MSGNLEAGRAQGTTEHRRRTTAVIDTPPRSVHGPVHGPANDPAPVTSRGRFRTTLLLGLALLSLAWAGPAMALGLGQATVRSYYQQPLDARIDLISRSEAEMATVTAGLASPADFQVMGLQRGAIATPLEFTINRDLGDPHIRVTSKLPMNEPVVQLVVEVVWASGRMLRQYTLFLDPPTFAAPAPLPATPPATVQRDVPPAGESAPVRTEPEIAAVDTPAAQTSPFAEEAPGALPPPTATAPPSRPTQTPEPAVTAADDTPAEPLVQSAPAAPADTTAQVAEPAPAETPPSDPVPADPVPASGPPFDPPADPPSEPIVAAEEPAADPVTTAATEVDATPIDPVEAPAVALDDATAPTPAPTPTDGAPDAPDERMATTDEPVAADDVSAIDTAADDVVALATTPEPEAPSEADATEPVELMNTGAEAVDDPLADAVAADVLDDTAGTLPVEAETPESLDDPATLAQTETPAAMTGVAEETPIADETPAQAEAATEAVVDDAADVTSTLAAEADGSASGEASDAGADAVAEGATEATADAVADTATETPNPVEAPTEDLAPETTPESTEALAASAEPPVSPPEVPVTEPEVATETPPVDVVYRAVMPAPGAALPATIDVQRGDTLWSLSRAYAQAEGVSVNQVMLAVQQANPQAFRDGNINRMMAGEVLRMPTRDDMLARNARDAMLEVMRQESLYRTRWDVPSSPDDIPTITNLADTGPAAGGPSGDSLADADPVSEESRLELVPPDGADAEAQGLGQGGSGETGVSSGESVVEELARTQEELANARQENAYLSDRVAELEAELGRDAAPEDGGVADTTLAEMEDRLRDERLAGEETPEIAVSPDEAPDSWFLRFGGWVFGIVALLVAGLVVLLRRQGDPEYTPRSPQGEFSGATEPTLEPDDDPGPGAAKATPSVPPEATVDADVPEVDAGPETVEDRLNLARAYVAMNKRDEARDQLEAVIRDGEPAQVREAREMLSEL